MKRPYRKTYLYDAPSIAAWSAVQEVWRKSQDLAEPIHHDCFQLGALRACRPRETNAASNRIGQRTGQDGGVAVARGAVIV